MITNILIQVAFGILGIIFVFFPVVTIASLPVIGPSLSTILITMVTTWNAFMVTFPYAQVAWQVFLFVILPFELLMLIGKFFLGHHLPVNTN